jgi:hypothetical protein
VNGESLSLPVVLLDDGDEISTGFQTVVFRSQAPATARQPLDTATE